MEILHAKRGHFLGALTGHPADGRVDFDEGTGFLVGQNQTVGYGFKETPVFIL